MGFGIALVIVALVAGYVSLCLVRTRAGTITLINSWGGAVIDALNPGWRWIWWPFKMKDAVVVIDKRSIDIDDFEMICMYDALSQSPTRIKTNEVSLAYELDFWGPDGKLDLDKLTNYYKLTDSKGTISDHRLKEFLQDKVQSSFQTLVGRKPLDEILITAAEIADTVKSSLTTYVEDKDVMLPIKVISLLLNKPVELTDPGTAKSWAEKAKYAAEKSAAKAKLDKDLMVAQKLVEIAETDGKAEVKRMEARMTAWCINALPDDKKCEALLAVQIAEAQSELARNSASKVVLGASLASECKSLIAPLSALSLLDHNKKPDGNQGA